MRRLIENYNLGTLVRYGLSYAQLREINPRLICCSITGFGLESKSDDQPD